MDPDCAICSQPAVAKCECEAKGLDIAVRQAEQKMMATFFSQIRSWVRGHAQDYILTYYSVLTTRRKEAHSLHLQNLASRSLRYHGTRPHPAEIASANVELKRGIDEDWRASVQRYPEVLEYFYSLVELDLPSEADTAVRDPPLSALTGARPGRIREKGRERPRGVPGSAGTSAGTSAGGVGMGGGMGMGRRPGHVGWAGPPPPGFAYAGGY